MSIVILTSKVGYGTYIPAIYAYKSIKSTSLYCIEDLLSPNAVNEFNKKIELATQNPRFAEISSYLPDKLFDGARIVRYNNLLTKWKAMGVKKFICFSGKWNWLLNQYYHLCQNFQVVGIVMDCQPSSIWNAMISEAMYSLTIRKVFGENVLLLASFEAKHYQQRDNIAVCHGGGWSLLKQDDTLLLRGLGFDKIRVLLSKDNLMEMQGVELIRFFCDFKGDFPCIVNEDSNTNILHPSLKLIRDAQLVLSKPGGMALMDCIMSETPMVLDSITIGLHEEANRKWALANGIAIELKDLTNENIKNGLLPHIHSKIVSLKERSKLLIT